MNNFINTGTRPVSGKKNRSENGCKLSIQPKKDWQERSLTGTIDKIVELGHNLSRNGLAKTIDKKMAKKITTFIVERAHNPSTSMNIIYCKVGEWDINFSTKKEERNFLLLVEKIWERSQYISQQPGYRAADMQKKIDQSFWSVKQGPSPCFFYYCFWLSSFGKILSSPDLVYIFYDILSYGLFFSLRQIIFK